MVGGYDPAGNLLSYTDSVMGTQWAHTNVWGAGQLLATYSADPDATQNVQGILNFYIDDPLGTRRVMTDFAGNIQETCHSLPYGNGEDCAAAPSEHLFTGKERDAESGNDYFEARYFGSSMGRFLSPDPLGGRLDNPQSLNKYSYGYNNPLVNTDPTGMYVCADSDRCDSKQDADFAKSLSGARAALNASSLSGEDLLNAKNALDAYGSKNSDNGVTVAFAAQPDPNDKDAHGAVQPNGFKSNGDGTFKAENTVTFKTGEKGDDLSALVTHEGSHLSDREAFAATIKSDGSVDPTKNITHGVSERRAFGLENKYRAKRGMPLEDVDNILNRPSYKKTENLPLYPDLPH